MRWFRANRTFGGRLALFALAVQLYLSFGHLHPQDIYGPAHLPVNGPIAAMAADHASVLTSDHRSTGGDDYCEICATISLLSTSFVAQAPQLPVPLVSQAIERIDRVAGIFIAPRRAPFQSRAPPAA
jgi:hypothetical protein